MSSYDGSSSSDGDAEDIDSFVLHNAAESGDVVTLTEILRLHAVAKAAAQEGHAGVFEGLASDAEELNLNLKDHHLCTALHVAIMQGQLECSRLLIEGGASVSRRCEGTPLLTLAICSGAHESRRDFALEAVKLLLSHGCSTWERDEDDRLPLHWAAELGLSGAAELLMEKGIEEQASDQGEENVRKSLMVEAEDNRGDTPVHCAARAKRCQSLEVLLPALQGSSEGSDSKGTSGLLNNVGASPLHAAAASGCTRCCWVLAKHCSASLSVADGGGRTPMQVAETCGHTHLLDVLSGKPLDGDAPAQPEDSRLPTMLFAPEACLGHRTFPEPLIRGACSDMPPENVCRLQVLIDPANGILFTDEFKGMKVNNDSTPASMVDILRVHEWNYIKRIQDSCMRIPDTLASISHLDPDTAVSHGTWAAGLAAAGSVCRAVDSVMRGEAQNAFCAIRPPGHHAGPTGVVTSQHDPRGSHGFCLLNNIAIGAAYAMDRWRDDIRRVAILDFDVHHGNGTEACVVNTIPSTRSFTFKSAFSTVTETVSTYKPWNGPSDPDNILFASVQGYGKKHFSIDAYVYPGSGATSDSRPSDASKAPPDIPEDPRREFGTVPDAEVAPGDAPRVINVGVPGPGARTKLWRRSWRDKIIPAVVAFNPDMIFISAGFDAHMKDEINFGYLGITEVDYDWITDQLCQVANRCCQGRIVSALEGGYRIQGKIVSPFARSVAAHVRVLNTASSAHCWSAEDAKREREKEAEELRKKAEEREKREEARRAALARIAEEERAAAEAAGTEAEMVDLSAASAGTAEAMLLDAEIPGSAGGRGKRRRPAVDYVALNRELEGEAAGKSTAGDEEAQEPAAKQVAKADPEVVENDGDAAMADLEAGAEDGADGNGEEWAGEDIEDDMEYHEEAAEEDTGAAKLAAEEPLEDLEVLDEPAEAEAKPEETDARAAEPEHEPEAGNAEGDDDELELLDED